EDSFNRHHLTLDIKYRQARHPLVEVRDNRKIIPRDPDKFIYKKLGQIIKRNDLIYCLVIMRDGDTVIFPQQVFYNIQNLRFNERIQQDHAWAPRDKPLSIVDIVALLSQGCSCQTKNILRVVKCFKFCIDVFADVRADHTILPMGMLNHGWRLRPDYGIYSSYLIAYLPRYLDQIRRWKIIILMKSLFCHSRLSFHLWKLFRKI